MEISTLKRTRRRRLGHALWSFNQTFGFAVKLGLTGYEFFAGWIAFLAILWVNVQLKYSMVLGIPFGLAVWCLINSPVIVGVYRRMQTETGLTHTPTEAYETDGTPIPQKVDEYKDLLEKQGNS